MINYCLCLLFSEQTSAILLHNVLFITQLRLSRNIVFPFTPDVDTMQSSNIL